MSRKKWYTHAAPTIYFHAEGGEDIKQRRIYIVFFVLLTVIKLAAPRVSSMTESGILKLVGGGEAMEIAEALGYRLTGGGQEDAVIASFLPPHTCRART